MAVTRIEPLAPFPAEAYRSTFVPDVRVPRIGDALPPGWEGVYFPFDAALADLRPDGSPAADGILDPVDLPRRMYAGEETVFHRPLVLGETVEQTARAGEVVHKEGRGGRLVFADIERELRVDGELRISSTWHDVFLEAAPPGTTPRPPAPAPDMAWQWRETTTLDVRQLFRFSALTFNTHRVHYDLAWARDEEGLAGLLVHGPLLRILLLDSVVRARPGRAVASFAIRSLAPVLVDHEVTLVGRDLDGGEGLGDEAGSEVLALDAENRMLARGEVRWG